MTAQSFIGGYVTGIDVIFSVNTVIDHDIFVLDILMMDLSIQYNYI